MTERNSNIMSPEQALRLQVFLARCGIGSRRSCESIILAGRVQVNGTVIKEMGYRINPEDDIKLDGRSLKIITRKVYIALHKPRGYICSNSDPQGRPLALDLIRHSVPFRLFHVGRLDFLSSGLILYTNDGPFARYVMHPSSGIPKVYLVETCNTIHGLILQKYKDGISVAGQSYKLNNYRLAGRHRYYLTLIEGKNREIRKVLQNFKVKIRRIHRVRIGNITIAGLAPGEFRFLSASEVNYLQSTHPTQI